MLPEEFCERWDADKNGPLIKIDKESLNSAPFSEEVKGFLSIGGLPETPAPYFEFTSMSSFLKPIINVFNMPEEFGKYYFLGTTGSGNPICIIEKQGYIVYLDNGNNFLEVFINSSIKQFAHCLLVYAQMIDKAIEKNGEDAFIDLDIPASIINWLSGEFERIDSKCMENGNFWFDEVESLYGS